MELENKDYFEDAFTLSPAILLSLIICFIGTVINITFYVNALRLERQDPGTKRTLINKLMSKLGWLAIVYLLLYTMTEPFRFFHGPMSINFCFAKTTLGSVILLQILMLIMSMTVTKYLFVFVLKNPLAIEDDFWCAFISRWIFSTGFLVQILVGMLPGKEPIYFYLCCGLKPPEDDLSNPKVRILQIIVLFGILSSLLLVFKVEHFKKRNKLKISGQNLENHACGRVNEHQFEGVAKLFSTTLIFVLTLFFQFILNKIPPQDLNVFPGNLAEHIFRVYWTNLISSFLYFTHFKRQKVDQCSNP